MALMKKIGGSRKESNQGPFGLKHPCQPMDFFVKTLKLLGRGGGPVVSILAFYSNNLSSNPADY